MKSLVGLKKLSARVKLNMPVSFLLAVSWKKVKVFFIPLTPSYVFPRFQVCTRRILPRTYLDPFSGSFPKIETTFKQSRDNLSLTERKLIFPLLDLTFHISEASKAVNSRLLCCLKNVDRWILRRGDCDVFRLALFFFSVHPNKVPSSTHSLGHVWSLTRNCCVSNCLLSVRLYVVFF